jgi:hypothetical protein
MQNAKCKMQNAKCVLNFQDRVLNFRVQGKQITCTAPAKASANLALEAELSAIREASKFAEANSL